MPIKKAGPKWIVGLDLVAAERLVRCHGSRRLSVHAFDAVQQYVM
jgi:hypothetical protein